MLKLSPYYLQKPFLLLHIQRIQCQPLHIRSGKHHLIIAGIDITYPSLYSAYATFREFRQKSDDPPSVPPLWSR